MDELAGLLGRERRLLEMLLFRLVEARHLLAAGEARFLPWAAAEVERAVERIRDAELLRAALVTRLAAELAVSPEALTLKQLALDSVEPYRTIFEDHRRAFFDLVNEIDEVTRANRRLAGQGLHGINEVLDLFDERAGTGVGTGRIYGPSAMANESRRVAPVRVDRAL